MQELFKIDSTQLKCYATCPMKYKLNYVECLRKTEYEEDSVDLRFGEAIHAALELFDEHNLAPAPLVQYFTDNFVDLPGEEVKTNLHGGLLLKEFVPYYRANFHEWETVAKEKVGIVKVGEVEYQVKIDRVIRWRGNLYVVDFKTTKTTRKHGFFDKFQIDWQPTGYVKWCREQYGECSGFIPIGMFMGYRKRAYQGEPAGFHCSFDYTIVNRTKEDIAAWERDVWLISERIEDDKRFDTFHRNTDACSGYRGCPYQQACLSGQDEMVMSTLYEKFNPFEYLDGEVLRKEGV